LADPNDNERQFGRLAVEQGHITAEQLVEAVRLQSRDLPGKRLGEILLDQGRIDSTQLLQILAEQRRRSTKPSVPAGTAAATGGPGAPATLGSKGPLAAGAVAAAPVATAPPPPAAKPAIGRVTITSSATAPPATREAPKPTPGLIRTVPSVSFVPLDKLLRDTIALGASDLHLHRASRPKIRVNGTLRELAPEAISF
jgi:hypothetical protein